MKKEKSESAMSRFSGKGVFPYQFAFTLLIPLRNIFLSPKKLIKRLELKHDSIVLEVGPGPGYFSVKIAGALPLGWLFLTDIQQEMLDYAKKRLTRKKIFNVEYRLCDGIVLPFEDNKFDRIFLVTVLGEIENKAQYIKEFYRVMHVNGILSFSELSGDPDKLSIMEIKDLLKESGFIFDKVYGSENNFTINFRKV